MNLVMAYHTVSITTNWHRITKFSPLRGIVLRQNNQDAVIMYPPIITGKQFWKLNFTFFCYPALFVFGLLNLSTASAQDDLMNELNKAMPKERDFIYATFKGTRLINLHTVETVGSGTLEFRIAHRFGDFSSGANNFWGLDG